MIKPLNYKHKQTQPPQATNKSERRFNYKQPGRAERETEEMTKTIESDSLTVEELNALANSEDSEERLLAASNPNTPEELLEELSNDEDEYVRAAVGINPSTPNELVWTLANDYSDEVRMNIAEHTTDDALLWELSTDENTDVRLYVASNKSLPADLALHMAQTDTKKVHFELMDNPNLTVEVVRCLAQKYEYLDGVAQKIYMKEVKKHRKDYNLKGLHHKNLVKLMWG